MSEHSRFLAAKAKWEADNYRRAKVVYMSELRWKRIQKELDLDPNEKVGYRIVITERDGYGFV